PHEGAASWLHSRPAALVVLRAESPFVFYPRYFGETIFKLSRYWSVYRECKSILDEVLAAPDRWTYTDLAIAPPQEDEFETFDLYQATAGGAAAVARKHRSEAIRARTFAAI